MYVKSEMSTKGQKKHLEWNVAYMYVCIYIYILVVGID